MAIMTQVVSSIGTREWLEREGVKRLRESLDSLPKQIADLKKQIAASKKDAERKVLAGQVAELEAYLKRDDSSRETDQIANTHIRAAAGDAPGQPGSASALLGRGHAPPAMWLFTCRPRRRLLRAILCTASCPTMADGYPDDWSRTLTALEGLDFDRVVAGHGSVQEGKSVLRFFRSCNIDELNEASSRAVERGTSLAEVQKSLMPERLKSLAGAQMTRVGREGSSGLWRTSRQPR